MSRRFCETWENENSIGALKGRGFSRAVPIAKNKVGL